MVGRKYSLRLVVVLSLVAIAARGASRPEAEQAKIEWLLSEVGNSKATFIRNGKEYEALKAVSHLKTKLLFAGKRVQTARQFIVGVASHSEETGKPYEIRLPDGTQKSIQVWLLERLAVYEKGAAARQVPNSGFQADGRRSSRHRDPPPSAPRSRPASARRPGGPPPSSR